MTGTIECPDCDGYGTFFDDPCDKCNGAGRIEDEPSADHVVVDTNDDGAFKCLHCGARYMMNLPCPLSVYAVAAGEFAKIHKHCEKK